MSYHCLLTSLAVNSDGDVTDPQDEPRSIPGFCGYLETFGAAGGVTQLISVSHSPSPCGSAHLLATPRIPCAQVPDTAGSLPVAGGLGLDDL